jgi:UDP-N-acetylmuramate dehydrogenase
VSASLREFNTLRLEARADELVILERAEELDRCRDRALQGQLRVLGEGSNVVLAPKIEGTVGIMRIAGREQVRSGAKRLVRLGAGESWHGTVLWTLREGLFGLENLALIPGSVGAAPVQNIGAYGVELEEFVRSVEVWDPERKGLRELDASACCFSYRDSVFKRPGNRLIITAVTLELSTTARVRTGYPELAAELGEGAEQAEPEAVAQAVTRIRLRKLPDPAQHANVGSFFKNPVVTQDTLHELRRRYPNLKAFPVPGGVKLAAAQLIDLAGWKARREGPVVVWPTQPLVLVNVGTRDGRDVLAFAETVQRDIEQRFGVRLEIEPDTVGF